MSPRQDRPGGEGIAAPGRDPLTEVVRREGGRILAVLAATTGDLQLAEDALADAAVSALEVWPRTGTPRNPAGWLYVAARRKAIDIVRREVGRHDREGGAAVLQAQLQPDPPPPSRIADDQLRLIFTCCHPAIDLEGRVGLALRTLCGLSTREVAAVLLVPEATMAKRLVRVKQKIARAAIPYRIPDDEDLPARLYAVAAVIHLVYTSGHHAGTGDVVRADVCDEAVRLARLLVELLPAEPTAEGLLGLLLLTDARRPARLGLDGSLVALADQDRSRWDHDAIDEGAAWLARSLERTEGRADAYQLQAAIAACHARAPSYEQTDWPEIVRLYGILADLDPNPVVALNAAVARAEVDGPEVALRELDEVDDRVRSHLWHLARAEMLRRSGRALEAVDALEAARAVTPTEAERNHIDEQLRALASAP